MEFIVAAHIIKVVFFLNIRINARSQLKWRLEEMEYGHFIKMLETTRCNRAGAGALLVY